MVFSSVPVYLDPPNWQQISQQFNHQPAGYSNENLHLPPLPPPPSAVEGDGTGSIRPRSMSDRARLGKVPQPEPALKCPRCESTNTKFCYFNNYSLTQPRHFCKTCRRYWTRGGALRNVPVGGGCRRNNKKSKGTSRSKSPVTAERQGGSSCNTSANNIPANSCSTDHILCNLPPPPQQFPFLPPLHHLSDFGAGDISLNFGGLQPPVAAMGGGSGGGNMEFHIGSSSSGGVGGGPILSSGLGDQWRMPQVHQFPFLAGLAPPSGLYQFEGEGIEPQGYGCGATGQLRAKPLDSVVTSQMSTVKMEENQARLHLSRNFLGDHYWGGNAWTDHLSGSITEKSAQR